MAAKAPGNLLAKVSVFLAIAALIVSGMSTYLSRSARHVSEKSARAQLFSNFQQQYSMVAAQFGHDLTDSDWHPPKGSDDWLKLKRYWDLCYVEWYATQRLHPELYGPLWQTFYSQVISDALDYPPLRGVLLDLMQRQRQDNALHKNEFYDELRLQAKAKHLSLEP